MIPQYKQTDWTGEEPVIDISERCSVCNDLLLNLRGGFFGAGRLSVYCSDACKMKAYRQRQKALRNVQHKELNSTLPNEIDILIANIKKSLALVSSHD